MSDISNELYDNRQMEQNYFKQKILPVVTDTLNKPL